MYTPTKTYPQKLSKEVENQVKKNVKHEKPNCKGYHSKRNREERIR